MQKIWHNQSPILFQKPYSEIILKNRKDDQDTNLKFFFEKKKIEDITHTKNLNCTVVTKQLDWDNTEMLVNQLKKNNY